MTEPVDRLPQTRKSYDSSVFEHPDASPLALFRQWYDEAADHVREPNAMTVSTLDEWGPSSRIVLLKGLDERGFLFFTDYDSAKGRQLADDPRIAVNFPWHDMERQVRIRGLAEVADPADSDAYFAVRPRGSQIGANVSKQSQPAASREQMQAEYDAAVTEFDGREVPRPDHWEASACACSRSNSGRASRTGSTTGGSSAAATAAMKSRTSTTASAWEAVRLYP
jgi:pyridoxamine 5'-phosphate oxidase